MSARSSLCASINFISTYRKKDMLSVILLLVPKLIMDIFRRYVPSLYVGYLKCPTEDYQTDLFSNEDVEPVQQEEEKDSEITEEMELKCQRRIGRISKLFSDYGIIDDKFYFDTTELKQKNLQTGETVRFVIYKSSVNVDWKVKQITSYAEDEWAGEDSSGGASRITSENKVAEENIVTKIEAKKERFLITSSENLILDLETLKCKFLPMKGDWVSLTVLVEKKNDGGPRDQKSIIEVLSLKAVRTEKYEGIVSHLSVDENDEITGIIGNEIFFKINACECGYVPKIGDSVLASVIESDQGALTKRAIKVVQFRINEGGETLLSKIEKERQFDSKHGIVIDYSCDKQFLKMGESTIFKVTVENAGNSEQKIIEIELKNSKTSGVMKIVEEFEYPISVPIGHSYTFSVKAIANNSGMYTDILLLYFDGDWSMGKILEIEGDIDEKIRGHQMKSRPLKSENENSRSHLRSAAYVRRLENIRKTIPAPTGFHVAGVRPTKPAAFIPIQLPQFPMPDSIRNVVIGDGAAIKKNSDIQCELQLVYPAMFEELNKENYLIKFHNLLHLEDLELSITIKKYDRERVRFEKAGDYLIMEIPNLAESRPSLIVGDSLQATDPTVTDAEKIVRYEAYIHKILNNAIRLKFNESFHQNYDGRDYSVTFKHSRTSIRRFHQAVNVVMDHLKSQWLFPDLVGPSKSLQVNVVAEYPSPSADLVDSHICTLSEKSSKASENGRTNKKKLKPRDNALDALSDSDSELEQTSIKLEDITPTVYSEKPLAHDYGNNRPENTEISIDWVERDRKSKKEKLISCTSNSSPCSTRINIKPRDVTLKWINVNLNHYQKEAVRNILRGEARPLPYIIFGPPGTGKTVTVVETILQIMYLMPESRLLVAAPSNSSADLICERLLSWNLLQHGDVVRLVGYNYMAEDRMSNIIKPICTCIDTKNTVKNGKEVSFDIEGIKYSTREAVGRHRITVSTCSSVGSLYAMGFPKNHFTHIIVDEAGQATEPEIMVPFAFLNENGYSILAGDPLQLGPVITSKVAEGMGLGESFLSRLLVRFPYHRDLESFPDTDGYDPRLVTRLLYNYRSVRKILDLYSTLFYESKLLPRICSVCSEEKQLVDKLEDALQDNPWHSVQEILFHGIKGKNVQDDDSPSWYNHHEIARVVTFMLALHNCGVRSGDIGIVTPYQKQVLKIREMLRSCQIELPKVGTVEEFQGQERMVIIVSTVRSDEGLLDKDRRYALGFVASKQRVNVAISRAKALLIIIGNPHLLCMDSTWRNLIRICHKRGYYVGCDLPTSITE